MACESRETCEESQKLQRCLFMAKVGHAAAAAAAMRRADDMRAAGNQERSSMDRIG